MIVIGLTGGIGSGKSTIATFFQENEIPVYVADDAAKRLMTADTSLIHQIIKLLGPESYKNNELQRKWVSNKVFNDKDLLEALNAIVHPAVAQDFKKWLQLQEAPYVIKEAAILFENGGYKECDFMVVVDAPKSIRIDRVIKRDKTTEKAVLARMNAQWSSTRKRALADVVIHNVDLKIAKESVLKLHKHLLRRIKMGW